jgi:hypothetical protein
MAKWTVANLTYSAMSNEWGQPPHTIPGYRHQDARVSGMLPAELHKSLGIVNSEAGAEG